MTRLPELHRQLVLAARREEERTERLRLPWRAATRGYRRRARLALVSLAVLLSMTTLALAASGVLDVGSTVPGADLHRASGTGVPVSTTLLPLRVADPKGGLPWGMRVVRTSRGLVCLQVGRVEHGQLGELGIDGAFGDDGEFHPLPADALPSGGNPLDLSDLTASCALSDHTTMAAKVAIPSSASARVASGADARRRLDALPASALRDLYFGALGSRAVSVTYGADGEERTQPVVAGVGAYLIVQPAVAGQPRESGGGTSGTGLLPPGPDEPLRKITYRLHGRLCEAGLAYARGREGAWSSHGPASDVTHPCDTHEAHPLPRHWLREPTRRVPLHLHLTLADGVVTGLRVSFRAPHAVSSAHERYAILLPQTRCGARRTGGELGGTGFSLTRDVRRGAVVSTLVAYPFRIKRSCGGRTVTVDVLYSDERPGATLVARGTVRRPPGTR